MVITNFDDYFNMSEIKQQFASSKRQWLLLIVELNCGDNCFKRGVLHEIVLILNLNFGEKLTVRICNFIFLKETICKLKKAMVHQQEAMTHQPGYDYIRLLESTKYIYIYIYIFYKFIHILYANKHLKIQKHFLKFF